MSRPSFPLCQQPPTRKGAGPPHDALFLSFPSFYFFFFLFFFIICCGIVVWLRNFLPAAWRHSVWVLDCAGLEPIQWDWTGLNPFNWNVNDPTLKRWVYDVHRFRMEMMMTWIWIIDDIRLMASVGGPTAAPPTLFPLFLLSLKLGFLCVPSTCYWFCWLELKEELFTGFNCVRLFWRNGRNWIPARDPEILTDRIIGPSGRPGPIQWLTNVFFFFFNFFFF